MNENELKVLKMNIIGGLESLIDKGSKTDLPIDIFYEECELFELTEEILEGIVNDKKEFHKVLKTAIEIICDYDI